MLGIGIGLLIFGTWQIGQVYISLIEKYEQGVNIVEEEVLVLPQLEFWTCQIGVFESRENGLKEQEKLLNLGFDSVLFSQNPWRVGVGLASSEQELLSLREQLNAAGISNIIKKVTIQEKKFKILGNKSNQMSETLKIVNNFIKGNYSVDEVIDHYQFNEEISNVGHHLYRYQKAQNEWERQIIMLKIYHEYQSLISQLTKTEHA